MTRGAERRSRSSWRALAVAALSLLGCDGTREPLLRTERDGSGGSGAFWVPSPDATWQIQLAGEVDTSFAVDLYVVDLDVADAALATLLGDGRAVACHFSAGTLEPWRDDDAVLSDAVIGAPPPNYPDERWLDIRAAEVRDLKLERVAAAAARGCTAVQPANLHGYLGNTGFPLSRDDAIAFALELAEAAHGAGLSIAVSDGDAALYQAVRSSFDFAMGFGCLSAGCPQLEAFRSAGIGLLVVEEGDASSVDSVCPEAAALDLRVLLKGPDLDAFRVACP